MKKNTLLIIIINIIVLSTACNSNRSGNIKVYEQAPFIMMENERIQLRFDDRLYCKAGYLSGGKNLSINEADQSDSTEFPPDYIQLNGHTYTHFKRTDQTTEHINDSILGPGERLILTGNLPGIRKTLTIEMYEKFPDVAVSWCSYTNLTDSVMKINKVIYSYYQLNRKLTNITEESNSFHYLRPLNKSWGETWSNRVLNDSLNENYIIPGTGSNRSGIPFIDVWGAELGMAIFHVEGIQRFLHIRLQVNEEKKVNVGFESIPGDTFGQFPDQISPGGSVTTWKNAVCVHKGDFFNGARRFGELLDAALRTVGKKGFIKSYPARAYEPYWKTWGMNDLSGSGEFTLDQVRNRLDELADYGFKAIMLDDGWQNCNGLWDPNPAKFKNQQAMINFVDEVHTPKWGKDKNKSFKIYLWFDLLGTDTLTETIKPLLVRDKDGSIYRSKQAKYALCPSYQGTKNYIRDSLIEKIIGKWGIDGLYTDWEDQNPLPCFAQNHHHNSSAESVELNYEAFQNMFKDIIQYKLENGWISQCACAAVHDIYQYPYYHLEDASDPVTNEQVRARVRWIKAIRGGMAPVGDGYVDKMNYNRLAGEPAQSIAIGSVITSVRWNVDELGGEKHAREWMDLYFSEKISSGEYLGLYDIAYESPETCVIKRNDGTLYYSFFDKTAFNKEIELKGLESGKKYRVEQYEDDINLGEVKGPVARFNIQSKEGNGQGETVYYYVLKCVPI